MSEQLVYTRRARRREETTISNAALLDKRLTLAQRGLFALMLTTIGEPAKPVKFYLKNGGISHETFCKYVSRLAELNYLWREQKRGANGQFSVSFFTLDDAPCTEKPYTAEPYTENPNAASRYYNNNYLGIEKDNIPPISPTGKNGHETDAVCAWNPDRFLAFWDFYRTRYCSPVKSSRAGERGAAAKAWDKLKLSDKRIEALGSKLTAIMRTEDWQRGIGIPAASTLLNRIGRGEFSLDELPEPDAALPAAQPRREVLGAWT